MGPLAPSSRLEQLSPAPVRAIFDRANELESQGRRILHLEIGRPDMDTPEHIKAATRAALDAGLVHYGPSNGIPELRAAIAEDLGAERGAALDPDGVIVTTGTAEALALATMAFLEPGDEVILPLPAWPNYERYVAWAGAKPIFLATDPGQGYQISGPELRGALSARTRMLVLCSPHNPTGAILDERSLAEIANELSGSRVLVLADEIYKKLTYRDSRFVSPASISAEMASRTITVGGFAKAFAMDGWRLGYLALSAESARQALKLRQLLTVCSPIFLQHGALAALRGPADVLAATVAEYQRRRDALMDALGAQQAVTALIPEGAFYLYLRYPSSLPGSLALAELLLAEESVAVVPGVAFGADQSHCLRVSFSTAAEDVAEGGARILRVVDRLSGGR
ncbi:pyridoxal phosphate-dependent aminotransferase [soil metagenome]